MYVCPSRLRHQTPRGSPVRPWQRPAVLRTLAAMNAAEAANGPFGAVLGHSAAADAIRSFGARAASVDATVLLTGESGTGKGILARAIHQASARRLAAFVAVNCAGVPEGLFESEFFGHTRGAFTGAQQAHRGLFEQAHGGTLFLDEIGELPLSLQAKLLTALEDREFRRVGGERPVRVDCRIIAATGVDLEHAVDQRRFRRDLYHRLLVLGFQLPPLREREGDAELLAERALASCTARYGLHLQGFAPAAKALLRSHPWPGNVRQLAHAVEAAVLGARGRTIELRDFPDAVLGRPKAPLDDARSRLLATLRRAGGNRTRAAHALGIARNTLRARMAAYGITDREIAAAPELTDHDQQWTT